MKISVIIPVYNCKQWLNESLDSVLDQSIRDIEVLCVDDGSTDGSLSILEGYAQKDDRIKILHQENLGAGKARNYGLKEAKGEFVSFVDSDDMYPDTDTLKDLYECAKKHDVKISGGYHLEYRDGECKIDPDDPVCQLVCDKEDETVVPYRAFQSDWHFQTFLFERAFLNEHEISFPDYLRVQDPPFLVKAMIMADRVCLLPKATYVYRVAYKKVSWNKRRICDMIRGHLDCIELSRAARLEKLHSRSVLLLDERYRRMLMNNIRSQDNIKACYLLAKADERINYEIFDSSTRTYKRKRMLLLADVSKYIADVLGRLDYENNIDTEVLDKELKKIETGLYDERVDQKHVSLFMLEALAAMWSENVPYEARKAMYHYVSRDMHERWLNEDLKSWWAYKDSLDTFESCKKAFDLIGHYEDDEILDDEYLYYGADPGMKDEAVKIMEKEDLDVLVYGKESYYLNDFERNSNIYEGNAYLSQAIKDRVFDPDLSHYVIRNEFVRKNEISRRGDDAFVISVLLKAERVALINKEFGQKEKETVCDFKSAYDAYLVSRALKKGLDGCSAYEKNVLLNKAAGHEKKAAEIYMDIKGRERSYYLALDDEDAFDFKGRVVEVGAYLKQMKADEEILKQLSEESDVERVAAYLRDHQNKEKEFKNKVKENRNDILRTQVGSENKAKSMVPATYQKVETLSNIELDVMKKQFASIADFMDYTLESLSVIHEQLKILLKLKDGEDK